MNVSFCNTEIQRKIYKCIVNDTCYLFVGGDHMINPLIKGIKKNIRKEEDDLLNEISDEIKENFTGPSISNKDKFIKEKLYLDNEYKKIFVQKDLIRDDDSIEIVLNKIAIYCSDEEINYPYIYAWYNDSTDNKKSLGFTYLDESIDYTSIDEIIYKKKSFCELVDERFIINGEKKHVSYEKNLLKLLNTCQIKDDIIYFITLKQFLESIEDGWTDHKQAETREIEECGELLSFVNGGIRKYWPYVNLVNVFNYPELMKKRNKDYEKLKELLNYYYLGMNTIESNFLKNKIDCSGFSLDLLKIVSEEHDNQLNLQQLFIEFSLGDYKYKSHDIQYTFMKLTLSPHTESHYKVYTKCFTIYEGNVSMKQCEKWIKGDIRVNTYGYTYLQKENSLLIKIYDKDIDKYISLIINDDGCIEALINDETIDEKMMEILINHCKQTIEYFINKPRIYSYTRKTINTDIFNKENYLDNIEFMDCQLTFSKEFFQDKQSKLAKDWNRELIIFMENFPMYTRIKLEEITDLMIIKSRYKRINNYGDISNIHSMITTYLNPEGPNLSDDEIIHKIMEIFGISEDKAILEFNTCKETMSMKLQQGMKTYTKVPIEPGAEIEIFEDNQNININLKDVKSLDEFKRIILFIKTMFNMYHSRIKNDSYIELFTKVNKTNLNYDEMSFTSEKSSSSSSDSGSLLFSDSDDGSDDGSDGSDVEFGGGAGKVVKSYYLNRLKEYDNELFNFKSNVEQKSGQEYGYAKYCTESPSLGSRQPIAVSEKELERINKSEDEGSGRKSYSNKKIVEGREHIHPDGGPVYICPLYWDIEKNLSIRPDYIKKHGIKTIDPKHGKKKVVETVLKRQGVNWKKGAEDFNDADYIITDIKERSKRLHPDGYGLPCCFSSNKTMKKIVNKDDKDDKESEDSEEREEKIKFLEKAVIKKGDSISTQTPAEPNEYSHIHPSLKVFFGQSKLHFKKRENNILFNYKNYEPNLNNIQSSGFLKYGVPHSDDGSIFKDSSFMESYIRCINIDNYNKMKDKKYIEIDEFINILREYFSKDNKNLFKQCSDIINTFKRGIQNLSYDEMIDDTFNIYFEWLKSDENRDESYILPLLKRFKPEFFSHPPTIVIFNNEDNSDKISMDIHSEYDSNIYIFIFKSSIIKNEDTIYYYEPLFYRKYNVELQKHVEISVFPIHDEKSERTKVNDIIEYIQSVNYRYETLLQVFVNILDKLSDSIESFYIDNQSRISYIITKKKYIIPIPPQSIPYMDIKDTKGQSIKYKFIYKLPRELHSLQETEAYIKKINENVKKLILFNHKKIKTFSEPGLKLQTEINKYKQSLEVLLQKKINKKDEKKHQHKIKELYSEKFRSMDKLRKIKWDIQYFGNLLSIYKQLDYFIIQNVIIDDKYIINIILKNGVYIPIQKELYKRQYQIEKGVGNLEEIDNSLYIDYVDERCEYIITKERKEKLIKEIYNYLIITIIEDTLINKEIENIKNGIKINEDKRKDFYEIIQPILDTIIKREKAIKDEIDQLEKNEKHIYEYILWKFIDYLLIYEYYQLNVIINEKINITDFRKSVKDFISIEYFTYYDYINFSIIKELFTRKSQYINSYRSSDKKREFKKKQITYKLDSLPYFIPKIYGNKCNVLYHIYENNNDMVTFMNAINEDKEVFINEDFLREILIKRIESIDEKVIKNTYNENNVKKYKNKQSIIDDIMKKDYMFQLPDFTYLSEYFKVCIMLITKKYNQKKNNEVFFYTYDEWTDNIVTETNVISFHHILIDEKYVLSNIMKNEKYSVPFTKLYENNNFKKVIDNIIDDDIEEYMNE